MRTASPGASAREQCSTEERGRKEVRVSAVENEVVVRRMGAWQMLDPKGLPASDGVDVVELAAAGRLQRITGFFGAFPPIPESWPEHLVWRGG